MKKARSSHGCVFTGNAVTSNIASEVTWIQAGDPWLAKQRWFVRLDEWQHRHHPRPWHGFHLWHWAWMPLCNAVERYWTKGT